MHVHTATALSAEAIKARFENIGSTDSEPSAPLIYAGNRQPPKVFLAGSSVIPPTAAEVAVMKQRGGSTDVVLRLMWGPLPAPFPRVLAGIGTLLGILILILSDRTAGAWCLASLCIVLPVVALLHQQQGERVLQSLLSNILDGATFKPKPH
jgi:hypothetical protein